MDMGFFDLFKKMKTSQLQSVNSAEKKEHQYKRDPVTEYTDRLIFSIRSDRTVAQVKNQLLEFAKLNKMTSSQIRAAEKAALMSYRRVDPSFIVSNVQLEPVISDTMKYIRILDVIDKFSDDEKRAYCQQRWDFMMQSLLSKMDDVNYGVLSGIITSPSLCLNRYLNIGKEKEKALTANTLYNISEKHILPVYKSSSVNIIYKQGEILHYAINTKMIKKKSRTIAIAYHGPQATIRIMRGLRYKAGMIMPAPIKEDYWDTEAEGSFWVTNQRIGFIGQKAFSFPISKIYSLDYVEEKFILFKEGRQNPFIIYIPYSMAEEPLAIISELLNR